MVLSLEDFVALSEEIAALSRAGIPLDQGLRELSDDLPRPLAESVKEIGHRLHQGEQLDQILADPQAKYPPAYVAVVSAGLRSGNLSKALEDLVSLIRRQMDLRRSLGLGFLYPLIVLLVAYTGICFTFQKIYPSIELGLAQAGANPIADAQTPAWQESLRSHMVWWGPLIPALLLAFSGWVWYASGRIWASRSNSEKRMFSVWRWLVPWWSFATWNRTLKLSGYALFSDLTALLLEHGSPLPDAIAMAGQAVGDRALRTDLESLTASLARGETAPQQLPHIPSWLIGLLLRQHGESLPRYLRDYAKICRDEALDLQEGIVTLAPIVSTLIWAGGATCLHTALVFGPYLSLLYRLARGENNQ